MRALEREIELRETRLLAARVRFGLGAWFCTAVLFVASDIAFGIDEPTPIHYARSLSLVALAGYFFLRRQRSRAQVEAVALALMIVGVLSLGLTAAYAPEPSTSLIIASVMVLGSATLFPWHFGCQFATVLVASPSLAIGLVLATGDKWSAVSEPMMGVFASFGTSLLIARGLERQRDENTRAAVAIKSDAEVSSALARVGRELISSLDEPALLRRLCELTSEVLECDSSCTFLIDAFGMLSAEARHDGDSGERQQLTADWITPKDLAPLKRQLDRSSFTHLHLQADSDGFTETSDPRDPQSMVIIFALRNGDDLVGFQTASYSNRVRPPTLHEERLARGMSDLASLALKSAGLVKQLAKANEFQNDFLANMSHELRTPLNVIIGYGEMMLDEAFGSINEELRATIERVNKTAEGQLRLITATLQISQFESRENNLEAYAVDLNAFVEELRRETSLLSSGESLELVWDTAADLNPIRTDIVKLKMVIINLIDNAIKFTDEGEVRVRTQQDEDGVTFTIEDTGPGIAEGAVSQIFEAFQQHTTPETQGRGGVGIGLYLVQRLLDALGGTIELETELGTGTCFRVWVPNDVDAQPEVQLRESA